MCSRYEVLNLIEYILERYRVALPAKAFDNKTPNGEIRPTDLAPIIGPDQTVEILPWGLDVSWQTSPVINARAETVMEKPTFKPLLNERVLVPASAYFEWRKEERAKIKTRIALAESPMLAMAGLRSENRFVILTCEPSAPIAHIHNRMPVILDSAGEQDWLNPDNAFADLTPLIRPFARAFEITEAPRAVQLQRELFG